MRSSLPFCLIAVASWSCPAAASQVFTSAGLRAIAVAGQPADLPGRIFLDFMPAVGEGWMPVINNSGEVAFTARVGLPGSQPSTEAAVYHTTAAGRRMLAHGGDPAPGFPVNVRFDNLWLAWPTLTNSGLAAFGARLDDPAQPSIVGALFVDDGQTLRAVATYNQAAPGLPAGVQFSGGFSPPLAGRGGHLAVPAFLKGPGVNFTNDTVLYSTDTSMWNVVVRTGQAAAGASGARFTSGFDEWAINSQGKVAFGGYLTGATTQTDSGVWAQGPSGLRLVAREGARPPGTPVGSVWLSAGATSPFFHPHINSRGEVAFTATTYVQDGANVHQERGLFRESGGNLQLLLLSGREVPGDTSDLLLGQFEYLSNDAGQLLLKTQMYNVGVDSILTLFVQRNDSYAKLIAVDDPAPGVTGARFRDIDFARTAMNADGFVAFAADLRVGLGGITDANDQGIWAQDQFGNLKLVMQAGDRIEVAPGDIRTVDHAWLTGGTSGDFHGTGFNDRHELLLLVNFTDFSQGLFVSGAVAVPEPATFVMGIVSLSALIAFARTARRNRSAPAAPAISALVDP